MTKILKENEEINCPLCKQRHLMTFYNSINIQINPELKNKVFNREINCFPCEKGIGYLLGQFLYIDNEQWIWLYPTFSIDKKEVLETQIQEQRELNNKMFGKKASEIYLVFGYDEFFELLNELNKKE